MAIKKALNKKKEPVKRAVKRTPATAVDAFVDETVGEMDLSAVEPNLDPTAVEVDFTEAPLTPDQIAERDALAGSNAAAAANNTTIPQQQAVQRSAQNFKDMFGDARDKGVTIIPLRNVMSAQEIETKLKEQGIIE